MANMKMATVLRNCIVTAVESRSCDNMFGYEERRPIVASTRKSRNLTTVTEAGWMMCACGKMEAGKRRRKRRERKGVCENGERVFVGGL